MSVLGLGTDIVEIARFDLETEPRDRLARRVLTDEEFARYQAHNQPHRYLAKRFAAKEAVVKAAGLGIGKGIGFQQVQIDNNAAGAPIVSVFGNLQQWCENQQVGMIHISLSDEQHYAVATVIIERSR